jgi:hypothetical protein
MAKFVDKLPLFYWNHIGSHGASVDNSSQH